MNTADFTYALDQYCASQKNFSHVSSFLANRLENAATDMNGTCKSDATETLTAQETVPPIPTERSRRHGKDCR